MEEEVTVPGSMFVIGVAEGDSGSLLDRPKPPRSLVMPLPVRLPVPPLADFYDEGEVALELVVDLVVAACPLLVLPEQVGPRSVDALQEVLVAAWIGLLDDALEIRFEDLER